MHLDMTSSEGEFQNPSEAQHLLTLYKTNTHYVSLWGLLEGHAEPVPQILSLGDIRYILFLLHVASAWYSQYGNSNFFLGTFWNFPSCFQALVIWVWGCGIWGRVLGSGLLVERHTSPHPRIYVRLFSMFGKTSHWSLKRKFTWSKWKRSLDMCWAINLDNSSIVLLLSWIARLLS